MLARKFTVLTKKQLLPLTCTRSGTCCHGNQVHLNPWELAIISKEKGLSPSNFFDEFVQDGTSLKFNGDKDYRGLSACSLYNSSFGCSVHLGRPLVCRLFPLGRSIQHGEVQYFFEGTNFPCLNGCEAVLNLPQMDVNSYLIEQNTSEFERAQDAYLEVVQHIADIAFSLLLETDLLNEKDFHTLEEWRKIGLLLPKDMLSKLNQDWVDILFTPNITSNLDVSLFVNTHFEIFQNAAYKYIHQLKSIHEIHDACVLMMTISLLLAHSIGADPRSLCEHWIEIAIEHGAR